MADYYPLIARAIEGLSDRSPEMRAAVYGRARSALIGQLETLDPPLPPEDIETERVALDAAIARIEAEYGPPPEPPQPEPARPQSPSRPTLASLDRAEAAPHEGEPLPPATLPAAPPAAIAAVRPDPEDDFAASPEPEQPVRPRIDSRSPVAVRSGRGRSIALASVLALVIVAIAVAAWFLRDRPGEAPRTAPVAQAPQTPADGSKLNERVGGPAPPPQAPGQPPAARADPNAAQRAILYEEDPGNPQVPKATGGRVAWKLDAVNAGQGQPLQSAVRATVEFPEAGFSLNMLIRRNLDPTLPASHTVELAFTTRPGEPGRAVRDVGLLQFKVDMGGRGTPVAGLPVPVRDNLFLIGLSNLPGDIERNAELMQRRSWIDLPIRTASGQRAIVSFEKGPAGEQVIRDAFQSWQ
jgi:hypothetical protein